jgi:hypothetical protein
MPAQSFSGTIIITRGSSPTARRMTFACQVLRQNSFARSETMQRAVAQPDLDSAGERNHVLAARGVMPIDERQAPVKITSAAKVGTGHAKAIAPNTMAAIPLTKKTHQ